tara:strand:+ start:130 stop:1431 length:1302 start_codon:yes stop_codon:yes gene_type:complete
MAFDPFSLATALTALFLVPLVNDLSGGRIGNALSQRGFKSNYQLSLDKYNKEQKLNKDTFNRNQSFANINRRLRGGGSGRSVTTRDGVLSFLGDPSRKLDDAPDIVEQNQSVLRGVETLGGFFPFLNTQQPNIDNQKIVDSGFLGVRLEIDKINRNIDAIAAALGQSAIFEEKYRKDMIDAMRKDLAEKGKDRSETRSERSIFNLITRPVEEVQTRFGNLADGLRNALLLSIGLETGAAFADAFGGDEGGSESGDEGGEEETNNSSKGPKVGDYYRGKDRKYYVLQSDGSFKKTNVLPKSGQKFDRGDFTPVVENIQQNNTPPPPGSGTGEEGGGENDNIDGKEVSFNLNNLVEGGNSNFVKNMFNPSETVAMDTSGLQGRDRFTFIDLTTKKEQGDLIASNSSAGSTLEDSILDGDPGRGRGYELFLSGATI